MENKKDMEAAEKLIKGRTQLFEQIQKVIVGQAKVVDEILAAFFAKGHVLLVGVPGLAKTLLVSTISEILDLKFSRIQFTPDLMPSDIVGYEILQENPAAGGREIKFIQGPVFANIVLADEINRTPPKTQSALLQAMQEYRVTVSGRTLPLQLPFMVLATQNPIEQEGTYPLPEAQLDRFFMQVNIGYPDENEEKQIVSRTTGDYSANLRKILRAEDIVSLQNIVRKVPVSDSTLDYAVKIARLSRPGTGSIDFVNKWILWGAGPRASQSLILAAKARCLMSGRFAVSKEDIMETALPVLRHRIVLNFQAEAEGISPDHIIKMLLEKI
ncbi:MAG: MoxR family ATPase [Elusimicrobia bacterium]|nr:MoxR family ATPase [Elusimicrobiota bacterium]